MHWYDEEYVKNIKCIEPETQANGMGRAASFVEIGQVVRSTLLEAGPSFWAGRGGRLKTANKEHVNMGDSIS